MAYDALAESVRLISLGPPLTFAALSRRHRFAPLAVDVDGDIAATRFLRRGVACWWDDIHLLSRTGDGRWTLHGGGGGSHSPDDFTARDNLAPDALAIEGGASVAAAQWLHSATLLAGPALTTIRVGGRRDLTVPSHGRLVVVWAGDVGPSLSAHGPDGRALATATL
ncbi:hypothetical protein KOI35_44880 [Actinoplanes bogorensis]|uniref:Uncharacterized protein n=1 Tax=Paractinoplanes bogorensis TaxID=1610840 RepID=A0ABS5Z4P6_9ACTN|nr:hypothetical protein [Actinoplanes bogorensis]MBU2670659.1 hypothetical protein [Actinoplanes bogorensis]